MASPFPTNVLISIELNTQVTNQITVADRIIDPDSTDDGASPLTYAGPGTDGVPTLGTAADYTGADKEVLSEDGTTITWEIASSLLGFIAAGETVTIAGILANTSMLGDGGEVSAVVRVNGAAVHSGSLKLADVKTGLDIDVTAASGVQCASTDTETAMITIKEAILGGISANDAAEPADDDSLVVDFLNIPEGVTVTVPNTVDLPTEAAEIPIAFALELVTGRTLGVTPNEDDDSKSDVQLSANGSGSATYLVTAVDDELDGEWVTLEVDFKWTAGNVIDMGEVDVSLSPVSTRTDANFDDENVPTPRFVATNNPLTVISVTPCETTLLFPYVTNRSGFDTGMAITNISEQDGICTIEYSGSVVAGSSDAPDDLTSDPVKSGEQWIALLSDTVPNFEGYITASCEFQGGYGFAFLTDGTVAHGYLAVRNPPAM